MPLIIPPSDPMMSSIKSIQIGTPTSIHVIYFPTWPPNSGFPIQAATLVLFPKPLLQLLQLFWAQHTPYAGLIHNDPAEKQELSSLEWFSEVVCSHIICRAELNHQFSSCNRILHKIIPNVNVTSPLGTGSNPICFQ